MVQLSRPLVHLLAVLGTWNEKENSRRKLSWDGSGHLYYNVLGVTSMTVCKLDGVSEDAVAPSLPLAPATHTRCITLPHTVQNGLSYARPSQKRRNTPSLSFWRLWTDGRARLYWCFTSGWVSWTPLKTFGRFHAQLSDLDLVFVVFVIVVEAVAAIVAVVGVDVEHVVLCLVFSKYYNNPKTHLLV